MALGLTARSLKWKLVHGDGVPPAVLLRLENTISTSLTMTLSDSDYSETNQNFEGAAASLKGILESDTVTEFCVDWLDMQCGNGAVENSWSGARDRGGRRPQPRSVVSERENPHSVFC